MEEAQDVIAFSLDIGLAIDHAKEGDYDTIYFIGWNNDFDWYGVKVPEGFHEITRFGSISIYRSYT
jgi:hypothetical protein